MMKAVYYVTLLLIILMMAFFAFNFFYDTFIDPYKKFKHSVVFLIATLILAVGIYLSYNVGFSTHNYSSAVILHLVSVVLTLVWMLIAMLFIIPFRWQ